MFGTEECIRFTTRAIQPMDTTHGTTRGPAATHRRGKDPTFMAAGERRVSREAIRGRQRHASRTTLPATRRASHREAEVEPRSAEPGLEAAASSRKAVAATSTRD